MNLVDFNLGTCLIMYFVEEYVDLFSRNYSQYSKFATLGIISVLIISP